MEILIILNDAPYGSVRSPLIKKIYPIIYSIEDEADVTVYMSNDAVLSAKKGQKTPDGYYNVERMLKPIIRRGTAVVCRTCAEARGLGQEDLMDGVRLVTLGEAAEFALEAEKILTY